VVGNIILAESLTRWQLANVDLALLGLSLLGCDFLALQTEKKKNFVKVCNKWKNNC
jgi:hypothetical protein